MKALENTPVIVKDEEDDVSVQTTCPTVRVGDRVRFGYPHSEARVWWDVRASDERYVVLTRQRPFHSSGELFYTIVDRDRGVRGPCNLLGQGFDVEQEGGCDKLMAALNRNDMDPEELNRVRDEWVEHGNVDDYPFDVEVSYRNNVPIEVAEVKPARARR